MAQRRRNRRYQQRIMSARRESGFEKPGYPDVEKDSKVNSPSYEYAKAQALKRGDYATYEMRKSSKSASRRRGSKQ